VITRVADFAQLAWLNSGNMRSLAGLVSLDPADRLGGPSDGSGFLAAWVVVMM
jgi:hypothetical protein